MEPADASSPPRDTEKNSISSSAGESEPWFGEFKRNTMNLSLEESLSRISQTTSSIVEFSCQMDEYEKGIELKDKLFMERFDELKKKEERVAEKERKLELTVREVEVKRKFLELKEKELEDREKKLELKEREVEEGSKIREVFEITDEDDDEPFTCPDPDFNDFNNTMSSFAVGQIWALYDPIDDMPRYYAQIRRVLNDEVSLRWLETVNKEPTPIACGKFRYGGTENNTHLMFSHEMSYITRGKSVTILPRKGETWALYRDWSKTWKCNSDQHAPPYNYDFVEVLTEFDSDQGIGVAYLGKVEGFTSVYKHSEQHGVLQMMLRADEMARFSHRVPSFKLTGDEKEGVPVGSFELDPAAIPRAYLKPAKVEDEH